MSAAGTPDAKALEGMTFEQLMSELERLSAILAAGEVGIEEAVGIYEQARELHRLAGERLDAVKRRVEGMAGPDPSRPAGL